MSKSVNEHQDRLIEETIALLQRPVGDEQLNTALPLVQFGMVETKVVLATERSDELRASVASSSVEILAASEQAPSPTAADPSRPRQTEGLQSDSLIDQTLSMVQSVSVVEPEPVISPYLLPRAANVPSPKERLDMERADVLRRVAVFRENQQRFQREREEYYAATMAKTRAKE